MSTVRRIVCLANSRKVSGRCIAGKDVSGGDWIRPVSQRPSREISEEERRYPDGGSAQILDLIDIPVDCHVPGGHQTENFLIDADKYWIKAGTLERGKVASLLDRPLTLWKNGSSSLNGENDRVCGMKVKPGGSLFLISPKDLNLHVVAQPKRRVRADFLFGGTRYNLVVTDPLAERAFLAKPDGWYALEAVFLCVSLGDVYSDGCCYKLVASII